MQKKKKLDYGHEYAVDVGRDYAAFYIDGKKYAEFDTKHLTTIVPDTEWYLILNTAISKGGAWPSPVNKDTKFPIYFHIDEAKVLIKNEAIN